MSSWKPLESSFTPSICLSVRGSHIDIVLHQMTPLTSGGDLLGCMLTGHSSHLNKSRGTAGRGRREPRPPRTQDCCCLLTTLSTLERSRCLWLILWNRVLCRICIKTACFCKRWLTIYACVYVRVCVRERKTRKKKASFFLTQYFTQEYEKWTAMQNVVHFHHYQFDF